MVKGEGGGWLTENKLQGKFTVKKKKNHAKRADPGGPENSHSISGSKRAGIGIGFFPKKFGWGTR